MEEKKIAIRKCPFCNGKAQAKVSFSEGKGLFFIFVKCTMCGAQTRPFKSDSEDDPQAVLSSIDAWNTRAKPEE